MAGLWPLSLQQRLDLNGKPYVGAKAYFYEAATLTPLAVYSDYDLGTELSNPVTADGYGVFPAVFLDEADSFYRVRVTTSAGTVLTDLTTLPIIGPSGGGGGAATPVDPDSLFDTGDTKWRLGTGLHTGWVRVNGRTIGSATSGASERANADTEALFTHLWSNFSDSLCPVSGGRGASGAADFAANKTITLPDARGRMLAGLDDMGNSAASRITSLTVTTGSDAITLGNAGGVQRHTLATTELPAHTHTGTTDEDGTHGHPMRISTGGGDSSDATGGMMLNYNASSYPAYDGTVSNTAGQQIGGGGAHTHTFTSASTGGGGAHNNMPPFVLATLYVKL